MYPESWSQITQTTTVFNYFLLVSWTFHQFLKFDRPRVKYMFLKDNFLVPCLSYFSFCESYYPSPKKKKKIFFPKEKAQGPHQEDFVFTMAGAPTRYLFCQPWQMVSQVTQPHSDLCGVLSWPDWAAVPTDACGSVQCHFKPFEAL